MRSRLVAWTACAAIAWAGEASAGVWSWGCAGPLGDGQVVFNRFQLLVMPGRTPRGKLDRLIGLDDLTKDEAIAKDAADIATYQTDDNNSGFVKEMTFTRSSEAGGKLTLTEKSSRTLAHSDRLWHHCRDEITDRFRKVYRVTREPEPARDVTLDCMEYTMSTRGGRTCR
jgi:hypothetical protein